MDIMVMALITYGLDGIIFMDEFIILQIRSHRLRYRHYLYTLISINKIYSVISTYNSNEIDEITTTVNDYIKNNNRNGYCVVGDRYIWVNVLYG